MVAFTIFMAAFSAALQGFFAVAGALVGLTLAVLLTAAFLFAVLNECVGTVGIEFSSLLGWMLREETKVRGLGQIHGN